MRKSCFRRGSAGWYVAWTLASTLVASRPASAVCIDAPDNLVALWRGESNADDVFERNNGALQGGTTFVDGEVGQAFSFDGTTASVKVPASTSLNVGTGPGLTIELWVNPVTDAARDPLVEWNRGSGSPNWGVHLWMATSNLDSNPRPGNVYANLIDTSGNSHVFYSANGFLTGGAFEHVALTYAKATGVAKLFHDGVKVAEANLGTFTPQTSYDLYFAARPGPTEPTRFGGALDEVAIYNRALSDEEILALRDAGSSGKCISFCGDPNHDGAIKAGDALFILQSGVGAESCVLCVCDVNDSGGLLASDALNTLKKAVGIGVDLMCPDCEVP